MNLILILFGFICLGMAATLSVKDDRPRHRNGQFRKYKKVIYYGDLIKPCQ